MGDTPKLSVDPYPGDKPDIGLLHLTYLPLLVLQRSAGRGHDEVSMVAPSQTRGQSILAAICVLRPLDSSLG